MANLVKIGNVFLNLERAWSIEDLFPGSREDKVVVRFGQGDEQSQTFSGREADDLRTWLNSIAVNLRDVIARDSES